MGEGFQEGVQQGPLITSTAVDKVTSFLINAQVIFFCPKVEYHVTDAKEKGGEVIVGGAKIESLHGSFYQPSVLINITQDMIITQEETFGPIAPIIKLVIR